MRIEKSVDIHAAPERVWPFLIEPEKILQWCITFRTFEYRDDERGGVGKSVHIEEKAAGPLMRMDFLITEWIEYKKVALRMTSGAPLKSYEQHWTLEPTESGCRFIFMEEIEFPLWIIGKLIGLFGRRTSESSVDQMLEKLKTFVEG